jgi:RNA polymerase sigma-70 factor (ECF subfamily)
MNATHLSLTGGLMELAADHAATETRALNGFRRLLDEVWAKHDARLAKLAVGLGLAGDQPADVLQDVYLMALRQPPAIDSEAELVRWLFRVTVNRCHLEHRRHGRWRRLWSSLAGVFDRHQRPAASVGYGELKRDVDRALTTLAGDDRTLVVMRYFLSLNSRQIAEIVGMPEATVRGRLRAARSKLAMELADWKDEG